MGVLAKVINGSELSFEDVKQEPGFRGIFVYLFTEGIINYEQAKSLNWGDIDIYEDFDINRAADDFGRCLEELWRTCDQEPDKLDLSTKRLVNYAMLAFIIELRLKDQKIPKSVLKSFVEEANRPDLICDLFCLSYLLYLSNSYTNEEVFAAIMKFSDAAARPFILCWFMNFPDLHEDIMKLVCDYAHQTPLMQKKSMLENILTAFMKFAYGRRASLRCMLVEKQLFPALVFELTDALDDQLIFLPAYIKYNYELLTRNEYKDVKDAARNCVKYLCNFQASDLRDAFVTMNWIDLFSALTLLNDRWQLIYEPDYAVWERVMSRILTSEHVDNAFALLICQKIGNPQLVAGCLQTLLCERNSSQSRWLALETVTNEHAFEFIEEILKLPLKPHANVRKILTGFLNVPDTRDRIIRSVIGDSANSDRACQLLCREMRLEESTEHGGLCVHNLLNSPHLFTDNQFRLVEHVLLRNIEVKSRLIRVPSDRMEQILRNDTRWDTVCNHAIYLIAANYHLCNNIVRDNGADLFMDANYSMELVLAFPLGRIRSYIESHTSGRQRVIALFDEYTNSLVPGINSLYDDHSILHFEETRVPRELFQQFAACFEKKLQHQIQYCRLAGNPLFLFQCTPEVFENEALLRLFLKTLGFILDAQGVELLKNGFVIAIMEQQNIGKAMQNYDISRFLIESTCIQLLLDVIAGVPDGGANRIAPLKPLIFKFINSRLAKDKILLKLVLFQGFSVQLVPEAVKYIPCLSNAWEYAEESLKYQTARSYFPLFFYGYMCLHYSARDAKYMFLLEESLRSCITAVIEKKDLGLLLDCIKVLEKPITWLFKASKGEFKARIVSLFETIVNKAKFSHKDPIILTSAQNVLGRRYWLELEAEDEERRKKCIEIQDLVTAVASKLVIK